MPSKKEIDETEQEKYPESEKVKETKKPLIIGKDGKVEEKESLDAFEETPDVPGMKHMQQPDEHFGDVAKVTDKMNPKSLPEAERSPEGKIDVPSVPSKKGKVIGSEKQEPQESDRPAPVDEPVPVE
jgi:hypothetical protein